VNRGETPDMKMMALRESQFLGIGESLLMKEGFMCKLFVIGIYPFVCKMMRGHNDNSDDLVCNSFASFK
jgi:hypothetical protein